MNKPKKAHYERLRDTSILYFPWDEAAQENPQGEYYMRGGICWPEMVERPEVPSDYQGYAMMGGQEVESKIVYIFEQRSYEVIENIIEPKDGTIQYEGLAAWLNRCWSRYFARDFYWHQDFELTKSHRLEIIRSLFIQPKPQLIEVPWHDGHEPHAIWKYVKLNRLQWGAGTQLHEELQRAKAGDKRKAPAVHALQCLLAGLERYPWRGEGR